MYSKRLIPVIGLVLLSLAAVFAFQRSFSERNLRIVKEKELQTALTKLNGKDLEIAQANTQRIEIERALGEKIAVLETAVSDLQTRNSSLESSLKSQEESVKALTEKISILERQKEALMEDNLAKSQETTDLDKKISALENGRKELLEKLKSSEIQKSGPEPQKKEKKSPRAVNELRYEAPPTLDTAKLGKVIVQKSTGKSVQVQHINDVYQFVIVNAGTREGLRSRTVLNIIRNDQIIAKAVVEKIKQDVSAAVLVPEWTLETPQVGDFVTQA